MAYRASDVVLVPFPYTDLSQVSVRPAVVISSEAFNNAAGDVTVAMVTSRVRMGPTDWALRDWMEAGLRLPSWVRARFVTLDQGLIQFQPGRLSQRDMEAVKDRTRLALDLS